MSDELKPCGHCGEALDPENEIFCYSKEFRARNQLTLQWWRECDYCGTSTCGSTPEEADEMWNNRPIEDKLRAENERLRNMSERFNEALDDLA